MPPHLAQFDLAHRQISAGAIEVDACRKYGHENQTRRNRRALEIFYLTLGIGELVGGDVVTRQPADAASDEVYENNDIEGAAHAYPVGQCRWRDAETDNIRQ